MKYTLEQKMTFLNLVIQRCDRLSKSHGDGVGCSMQCRQLSKAIEDDLKMLDAIERFDGQKVN